MQAITRALLGDSALRKSESRIATAEACAAGVVDRDAWPPLVAGLSSTTKSDCALSPLAARAA
jgi:nicotinamide mononucleotide (NMN) deamidase PncC